MFGEVQGDDTKAPVDQERALRFEQEKRLVEAVQAGDAAAFGKLVERYLEPGYVVAISVLRNRHDAEDAVQNAFVRAMERMDQLRPGSPFGPWFYRVLRSTCLNLRRRESLRTHEGIPVSAAGVEDPLRDLEKTTARERVLDALGQLPEMQRMAVSLYDLEGYSHREIADTLGIAVGTSRAHVHHARKALGRIMEQAE
ncbi:MAG: RNA polymerase sigma factor [Gemmatimonadota bacterium]